MPTPDPSPALGLPVAVHNGLKNLSYNATKQAFESSGTFYYLFVEKKSSPDDCAQWNYGTNADGANNPRANIPQDVYDIITGGTYNSSEQAIDYGGSTYHFKLTRNGSGLHVAAAVRI